MKLLHKLMWAFVFIMAIVFIFLILSRASYHSPTEHLIGTIVTYIMSALLLLGVIALFLPNKK